jgi:hypothetical protein
LISMDMVAPVEYSFLPFFWHVHICFVCFAI